MINKIRQTAYSALLSVGIDAHRRRETLRFLSLRNIQTVLDVGANEGQFARRARNLFPQAEIYSFEPIPHVFHRLTKNRGRDANFKAVNRGLGDKSGEFDFEENKFSPSSSMLGSTSRGIEAYPFTAEKINIRISVTTLDEWAESCHLQPPILVKLDVQGYEDRVIRGGERTIARTDVVISEVSFVPLYKGQPLFDDIYAQMRGLGFRFAGMIENLCDPGTGEILQADAIFISSRCGLER